MAFTFDVTIDATKVGADLTDFPVYINLADLTGAFWGTVTNGGGDIRCYKSDGTTELPREVVSCDTSTNTGELHVLYDGTLSSSTDTVIKVTVDGSSTEPASTATYGRNEVWSDYLFVWHGAIGEESTGKSVALNGTPSTVAGQIGKAGYFDGVGDNQEITATYTNNVETAVTTQAWFNTDALSVGNFVVGHNNLKILFDSDGDLTGSTQLSGANQIATAAAIISTGVWYSAYNTYNDAANEGKLYLGSGASISNVASDAPGGTTIRQTSTIFPIGASEGASGSEFEGEVDEVRVRFETLSPDWITTEYANQSSSGTFYSTAISSDSNVADVTIDSTKVDADLTDFPVYVDLSLLPASFWSAVANGGGDIRVFKEGGTVELPREVVSCDTTAETGEVWIKVTSLSSSVDTVLQVHVDGSSSDYAVTDLFGRNEVWSEYAAVYHMADDPSGGTLTDSTGNGYDMTTLTSMAANDSVAGQVGSAIQFNGSNEGAYVNSAPSSTYPYTLSAWASVLDASVNDTIIFAGDKDQAFNRGFIDIVSDQGRTYSSSFGGPATNSTGGTVLDNTPTLFHGTLDISAGSELFINGSSVTSNGWSSTPSPVWDRLALGYAADSTPFGWVNGWIDEARFATAVLDSNWITTEYANQSDPGTFYAANDPDGASGALSAEDVTSTSTVGTPALEQEHSLSATDVSSTSTVSTPTLAEVANEVDLTANDVTSTSTVTQPTLAEFSTVDTLTANDVSSTSNVTAPGIAQEHSLASTDVFSVTEISTPTLQSVAGQDSLLAEDVTTTSSVSVPALAQTHAMAAQDVVSTSIIITPALGQTHNITAVDVQSATSVSTPAAIGDLRSVAKILGVDVTNIKSIY